MGNNNGYKVGSSGLFIPIGASYDGSKTGSDLRNWKTHSPNAIDPFLETYGTLSSRNATLANTTAVAIAAIEKPASYVIGDGLFFWCQPDAEFLELPEESMVAWGDKVTSLLDYAKLSLNWYEKQRLAFTEAEITGDSIIQFVRDKDSFLGLDLVVSGGYTIDWAKNKPLDSKTNRQIIMGIECDNLLRRTGFVPVGSDDVLPFVLSNGNQNAIQVFWRKKRADSIRGMGCVAAGIAMAKNVDSVWAATLERMIMESLIFAVGKASSTDILNQLRLQAEAAAGNTVQKNVQTTTAASSVETKGNGFVPGTTVQIKNEENFDFTKLETPSNNFKNAIQEAGNNIAMIRGVGTHFLSGDYTAVSFTGASAENLGTYRMLDLERADFYRKVEYKVNFELVKRFAKMGMIDVIPAFWTNPFVQQAYLKGTVLGPIPGYINPLVGVKADRMREEDGVMLKSTRILRDSGGGRVPKSHIMNWSKELTAFNKAKSESNVEGVEE